MMLKANDRRTSCPCHDEFRGPRSDYVRQVASENNNNVVAFIVFEEGFHQPIKRTKQSVFLDVTVFRHTLVD
ncbi:hypothetical protein TNCV_3499541 [Trichonephila clavipes]|nr:hypothetical protein TNCV_3499541 [Trichonephila clavipes]